ncbi:hypothetical protein RD2015_1683 [Roseateles depolymerans]|uniref:Uncharacterized protein n=1 Tax=Roseateles depolymerans TaxID=76731 RepID=A0A0U3LMM2_9BURK|nr:hypothetical protein RD2015_1683 [Roseateles depolymerans]
MSLAARCQSAPLRAASFPPATLIRLYELLKNNSAVSKTRLANQNIRRFQIALGLTLWFANREK